MSEHDEQVAFFKWVDLKAKQDDRYLNIYAIPNGGLRNKMVAIKLKREGVRPGVFDIAVDWPIVKDGNLVYAGLRIEMKFGKNKLTENQKIWKKLYETAGYKTEVCYTFEDAKSKAEAYFSL